MSISLLIAGGVQAQALLTFTDRKASTQTGELALDYDGGGLVVRLTDGQVFFSGCLGHPNSVLVQPSVFCPLGTTALIEGEYWSVSSLIPASSVEPARTDLIQLTAPPGGIFDILEAAGGDLSAVFSLSDQSMQVWYDLINGPIEFNIITEYRLERLYGSGEAERQRHHNDVQWGTYAFRFPSLGAPQTGQDFAVGHLTTPEPYPGPGPAPDGLRLANDTWSGGQLRLDPRSDSDLSWLGVESSATVAADRLLFSLRANQWIGMDGQEHITRELPDPGEVQPDGLGRPQLKQDVIVYPGVAVTPSGLVYDVIPFAVPEEDRDPLSIEPDSGGFSIAAGTFDLGASATGVLEWKRNFSGGGGTSLDASERTLKFAMSFVDTEDTDGDGMSNWFEEEHGLDPLNPDQDGNLVPDGDDDYDGDGIPGAGEESAGTSPLTADSDLDLLPDNVEINQTATSPIASDSDGDGISDAQENPDGDSYTHFEESILHLTDPCDGSSFFALNLASGPGGNFLSFPMHAGRRYTLERSENAIDWQVARTIPGAEAEHRETVETSTASPVYYRVRVELNP